VRARDRTSSSFAGVLYTPPFNGTLLAGITRDSALTIADDLGMRVREQAMPRESLYPADQISLAGTASEVTPVRSLDRLRIGSGKRGAVTETVQQPYLDVARGAAPQMRGWLTYVRCASG
jgi:branched-chain amino acid aminotransferase